jgi:hypothetical protein
VPPSIRLGFGSLVLELPKWLIDSVKQNVVLWAFAILTVFNLYLTYLSRHGEASLELGPKSSAKQASRADGRSGEMAFAKTFVFWVPEFSSATKRLPDSVALEAQFHKSLSEAFGGWTRWRASGAGSGSTTPEEGWVYQASLPKSSPDMTTHDVQKLIRRHFLEANIYVVEMRHQ